MIQRLFFTFIALCLARNSFAQDDLLNMLKEQEPQKPVPVYATFKSTRVITGQSNEQVASRHLNFVILHRFGTINGGAYEFFGLDQANIRLAFDYGLTNNIQVGIARSSYEKTYDGNIKIKLLKQSKGKGGIPFSISYYGNTAINTVMFNNTTGSVDYFSSRFSYLNQIIVARKFNDKVSMLLAPGFVHRNLVTYRTDPNTLFILGAAASIRLSRSVRFNAEYYARLNGRDSKMSGLPVYDYLGLGFDIETGGHVFQLMFCNGIGMLEQHMITNTTTSWSDIGMRLGFNISRNFSFDRSVPKTW